MPPVHESGPSSGREIFGSELEPALLEASEGRLTGLRWFQADWQRGGAATAYGSFSFPDGTQRDVVVKAPVGPVEHRFTTKLWESGAPTPGVAAHGHSLGGYDMAWLVMERLTGEPISKRPDKKALRDLAGAAAAFYQRADAVFGAPPSAPEEADWADLLSKARSAIKENSLPSEQRWNDAVKKTQRALPALLTRWSSRAIDTWRHGDLHLGNAMTREDGSPWGPAGCILIDLGNVRPGHWVEDAVYLERVHWAEPDVLQGAKPVKLLAKARRDAGFRQDDDYNDLANIRRTLLAACVPAFLHREGHPRYLAGALDVLERTLPLVA